MVHMLFCENSVVAVPFLLMQYVFCMLFSQEVVAAAEEEAKGGEKIRCEIRSHKLCAYRVTCGDKRYS
jgi:hypothetical protein